MNEAFNKKKVLVSIIHQGWIRPEILPLIPILIKDGRYDVHLIDHSSKPYQNSLNQIRKKMLDEGFDYWVTFDHDNVPLNNPLDLIGMGDVIGMPYPTWMDYQNGDIDTCVLAMSKDQDGRYKQLPPEKREGFVEVDAIASGAMVLSRAVVEKLFFEREWNGDGIQTRGIDFNFCKKAQDLGFKIYAHFDYLADHHKEQSMFKIMKLLSQTHGS